MRSLILDFLDRSARRFRGILATRMQRWLRARLHFPVLSRDRQQIQKLKLSLVSGMPQSGVGRNVSICLKNLWITFLRLATHRKLPRYAGVFHTNPIGENPRSAKGLAPLSTANGAYNKQQQILFIYNHYSLAPIH